MSRELDELIALRVMCLKQPEDFGTVLEHDWRDAEDTDLLQSSYQCRRCGMASGWRAPSELPAGPCDVPPDPYGSYIGAAWQVAEHLTTAHKTFHLWCSPLNGEWHAETDADDGSDKPIGAWADTAPLAICRGALLAVGVTPPA